MKHPKDEDLGLEDLEQLAEKLKKEGRLPSLEHLAAVLHAVAAKVESKVRKPRRGRRAHRAG
jgi:hypothetical protein